MNEKTTERPTIDLNNLEKVHKNPVYHTSDNNSFFKADPGFKQVVKVPSGRRVICLRDKDGLIRYKYDD